MFYVIEGLDGTGKSTQLELLKKRLPDAEFLSFPNYGGGTGGLIRQYLSGAFAGAENDCWLPTLLYAVDRCITMRDIQISDKTVVSARYTTSNAIYQGAKLPARERDEFFKYMYDLEYGKLRLPKPDKIIFLYLPEKLQWQMLEKRGKTETGDDFHETEEFQRQCRDCAGYLAMRDNWKIIDCSDGREENPAMRSAEDINNEIIMEIL